MVNGLLLRPYISGMVWKMSDTGMKRMQEGIALYKEIRSDVRDGVPFFPLGFGHIRDKALAYGIINGDVAYLAVFTPATDEVEIPLTIEKEIAEVSVIYPKEQLCEYSYENGVLHVKMPQKAAARLFRIQLK